jgi:hypothetical protein
MRDFDGGKGDVEHAAKVLHEFIKGVTGLAIVIV